MDDGTELAVLPGESAGRIICLARIAVMENGMVVDQEFA